MKSKPIQNEYMTEEVTIMTLLERAQWIANKGTMRFYTDSNTYMGWCLKKNYRKHDAFNWIKSGNYIRFNNEGKEYVLRDMDTPSLIDILYRISQQ